ncbi:hypothetical protein Poly21_16840 [Allorhodopirellula heiligendammensis]|uniref:Uncharacterized protein n=1 Tax=Allorhodopirellula heiligendammensis TaxID=2714739 RepID=A0A5C6C7N6_9BACT|nr:hypothetical protein Poly21_16840 [Allorhodopirellula heiligendammensis]
MVERETHSIDLLHPHCIRIDLTHRANEGFGILAHDAGRLNRDRQEIVAFDRGLHIIADGFAAQDRDADGGDEDAQASSWGSDRSQ